MYITGEIAIFLSFRQLKKQNAIPCRFKKELKGPPFLCKKCVDQKYF